MEMRKTYEMVEAEAVNLLETEWKKLVAAYRNSGCELGISIKIDLLGNLEVVKIVTGLEYYPLPKTKIKNDPITVDENQMSLTFSRKKPKSTPIRKCRVCGCDDNHACMTEEGPCYWVEDDLCSACAEKTEEAK